MYENIMLKLENKLTNQLYNSYKKWCITYYISFCIYFLFVQYMSITRITNGNNSSYDFIASFIELFFIIFLYIQIKKYQKITFVLETNLSDIKSIKWG